MDQQRALKMLDEQIATIDKNDFLEAGGGRSLDFSRWRRNSEVLIRKIFGDGSHQVREFAAISYRPMATSIATMERDSRNAFLSGLEDAEALLSSVRDEVERYSTEEVDYQQPPADIDVFISYATKDSPIAEELWIDLENKGLRCFKAEKDIAIASEWQDSIREALISSRHVLILITPRSLNRPWILMEIGAAWALSKPLIPALSQVDPSELPDPVRLYQAHVIETTAQRQDLVKELSSM